MRKFAALLAALGIAGSSARPAAASISRLLSLGTDNWQVHDSANFWHNPALLRDIPDAIHLELGSKGGIGDPFDPAASSDPALTTGSQWGGVHKAFGRHVFAMYVRRPYGSNDFNTVSDPLILPGLGGMITNAGVTANGALDTGGFGVQGPFGTTGGSILGITGAPSATQSIAAPSNFFDFFWAVPMGPLAVGIRFNYARNAPGEVRRVAYNNIGSGAGTEGTMLLERITNEYNIQPGLSIRGENVRFDLVGDISIPYYRMEYREQEINGDYLTSKLQDAETLGGGISAQLTMRAGENDSIAVRFRAGDHNVAGTASLVMDNPVGGALERNERASFDNRRRFVGGDLTWNHLFERVLIVTSVGYIRSQIKQSWNFTDVLNAANNQADLNKIDRDIVPMRLAIEITPWDRIALRFGIQKNWFAEGDVVTSDSDAGAPPTVTQTSTAGAENTNTADGVGLSFGVGIRILRNLSIDTVVRQKILFNGPDFIGGQAPGLFAQGSLVYRFGLSSNSEDTLKPLLAYDEIKLY